jgi:ABC-2 type transport system ATP-binding protein
MISADGLTMRYGNTRALSHVTFRVNPGQIYCLLGPHGSGKTTAINLLFGILKPSYGTVSIEGFDSVTQTEELRKRAALVSDAIALYDNLTTTDHLQLFGSLSGRGKLTQEECIRILGSVDLPEATLHQRIRRYGAGMRVKLSMAIALLKNASAILMDEPGGGLDPHIGAAQAPLITEMREQGKAILVATNDLYYAQRVADVIGFLREGALIHELHREDFAHENLEKLYTKILLNF